MTVKNDSVNHLSVVLLMGAAAVAPPASAAWSRWQNESG
ncbi:hypothetical protein BACIH_1181 [Bacillus amyloliquefaciens]|nr:hypothetical protein U471_12080 [Bacillus amyloliquefaciens CC178]QEY88489.1 hypothetical protein BACIT_0518 [Bacillus amyloliquefaciens]QEY92936.1 hypothetical protein BACIH_1181 [Bacillus amyloliquefaciens]